MLPYFHALSSVTTSDFKTRRTVINVNTESSHLVRGHHRIGLSGVVNLLIFQKDNCFALRVESRRNARTDWQVGFSETFIKTHDIGSPDRMFQEDVSISFQTCISAAINDRWFHAVRRFNKVDLSERWDARAHCLNDRHLLRTELYHLLLILFRHLWKHLCHCVDFRILFV